MRKEQIEVFVRCIELKEATADLQDNDSDGYIQIKSQQDNFIVRAQIGGTHEENFFIEFLTGSHALLKFTKGLRELLNFYEVY